jgi:DNA-binding NtrC family response regulator
MRLVALSGQSTGAELVVQRGTYYVGTSADCDLPLTDPAVSRRHLEVVVRSEGVQITDLGSKNGSFLKGTRFDRVTIGVGTIVTIGRTDLRLATLAEPAPAAPPSDRDRFGDLRGRSLAMRQVYGLLERIADASAPVLIEGETGTGKEVCAAALHAASGRREPFVVCDLAGVPRSLIESELFGHVRGAFTGADRDRVGAFEAAGHGTLFIDEIGELEPALQPRLLRVLEQHEVQPVGSSQPREVPARILAATHLDLRAECKAGRFREDLYHRLAVLRVTLPPLRARKEDLPQLVPALLEQLGGRVEVAPAGMALLSEYDWPGNVRELRNVLERACALVAPGEPITAQALGLEPSPGPEGFHQAKERLVSNWERGYLADLLRRARGNVARAARMAGLNRPHLYTLLKKHGLGEDGDDG